MMSTNKNSNEDNPTDPAHNKKHNNMNENLKKKTFTSTLEESRTKIRDRIKSFEQFSSSEEKCLMGSGRCATHNCKLIRVMKEKRVSCVDKCGRVSWTMREGATLVCPKSGYSTSKEGQKEAISTQLREGGNSTNKKQRFYSGEDGPIREEIQPDRTENNRVNNDLDAGSN